MSKVKLSREVGLMLLLFYGLGNILGAGIYVLVGKVVGIAGYFTITSFLLACLITLFTALSYSELVSRYPLSAGAALYIQEGIGMKALSIGVGLLIAVAGLISVATISHGFVGYLTQFVQINETLAIILLVLVLVIIAIIGIKASVIVATVLTCLEIFGLLMIIYYGQDKILHPTLSLSTFVPSFSFSDVSVVFFGAFLAFYAFIGFEDMVNIAEEVKEPRKSFPTAMIAALIISTLLYVLIVLVALETLSLQELKVSKAPFADIFHRLTGKDPVIISAIGTFAVINGALIQMIMASRIVYGMASKGWLPPVLSHINTRTKTPVYATLLVGVTALVFALLFDIVSLASLTSLLVLIVFTLINISLIRIKNIKPVPDGVIQIPVWVPYAGIVLNLLLIFMSFLA